jgi:hypothetical protein
MLTALESAIASGDPNAVQQAVFDLRDLRLEQGNFDDEVAFEVLTLLKRPDVMASPLAAHLLNFFEFEAPRISQRAKDRCITFLGEWGDKFSHLHAQHVVAELRSGRYLKPEPLKVARKKPLGNRA